MHEASETIRKVCLGVLLALVLFGGDALPAASVRRAPARHRRRTATTRRAQARRPVARLARESSYMRASVRIPSQLRTTVPPAIPVPAFPPQDEQRIPRQTPRTTAALQGIVRENSTRGIVGAMIALTNRSTGLTRTVSADADGVFRFTDLAPGTYVLSVQADGFEKMTRDDLRLDAGDVVTVELTLAPSSTAAAAASRLPRMPELGPPAPAAEAPPAFASYRELRRRPDAEPGQEIVTPEILPPSQEVFLTMPDRWNIAMPEWNRYGRSGEYPYVRVSHWWDPFNRNRLKGDDPIFGQQTFLNITATTGYVRRRAAGSGDEQHHLGATRQQRFFRKRRTVRAERDVPILLRPFPRRHFVPARRLADSGDARRQRELSGRARAGNREH